MSLYQTTRITAMFAGTTKTVTKSPLPTPSTMNMKNPYFTDAAYSSKGWFFTSLNTQKDSTSNYKIESVPNKSNSTSDTKIVHKAKPSQLREMNFWSPTSM